MMRRAYHIVITEGLEAMEYGVPAVALKREDSYAAERDAKSQRPEGLPFLYQSGRVDWVLCSCMVVQ
jgi:hypothetical protein